MRAEVRNPVPFGIVIDRNIDVFHFYTVNDTIALWTLAAILHHGFPPLFILRYR
jgi:hypothetical protein